MHPLSTSWHYIHRSVTLRGLGFFDPPHGREPPQTLAGGNPPVPRMILHDQLVPSPPEVADGRRQVRDGRDETPAIESVDEQEPLSVTVTTYVVVVAGVANGLAIFGLLKPVVGLQE